MDAGDLNKRLKELMDGLSVKVCKSCLSVHGSQKQWVDYVREDLQFAGLSFTWYRKSQDRAGWRIAMDVCCNAPDLRIGRRVTWNEQKPD